LPHYWHHAPHPELGIYRQREGTNGAREHFVTVDIYGQLIAGANVAQVDKLD
jgi:hypothetical protein